MIDFISVVASLYMLIGGLLTYAVMKIDEGLPFNALLVMILFWPAVLLLAVMFAILASKNK